MKTLFNRGDLIDTTEHGFLSVECPLPFTLCDGNIYTFYWLSDMDKKDLFYWEKDLKAILTEGELFLLENDLDE